jgi:hypothetical protein
MQPGTGPSSVTSTTKYRQRTRRRYPPADKPSWNWGHSSMRSGDAGQGAQKSGWGRLLRPLVMTQVWLSSPHRSRHSCDGERHLVARFLRADQVQARTDVRRTVRDRAATIHGWTTQSSSTWSVAGSSITNRRISPFVEHCVRHGRRPGPNVFDLGDLRPVRVGKHDCARGLAIVLDWTAPRSGGAYRTPLRRCLSHVPRWRDAGRMQTPLPR